MSILGSLFGGAISAAINRYKSSSGSGSSGKSSSSGGSYSSPSNSANNSYQTAGNWARNVWGAGEYGPLTGTVGSRTMATPAGLKTEGVDFYINPSDNRAYTYDWNSPQPYPTPEQPPQPQQYPQQPMMQQQEFDPSEYIRHLEAAKKTEGPFENPYLEDDSENDDEAIE